MDKPIVTLVCINSDLHPSLQKPNISSPPHSRLSVSYDSFISLAHGIIEICEVLGVENQVSEINELSPHDMKKLLPDLSKKLIQAKENAELALLVKLRAKGDGRYG